MIKYCVVCGKEFRSSPSDKKITCSKTCSRINKSNTHKGVRNVWSPDKKSALSQKGKTPNLQKGTPAAQKSPKSGRFVTNVNAKDWHLVSPDGKHYHFHSLNNWLRENGKSLFGCEPDTKEFTNVRSGLSGVKRAMLGGTYGSCTYKGWRVIPLEDEKKG